MAVPGLTPVLQTVGKSPELLLGDLVLWEGSLGMRVAHVTSESSVGSKPLGT